MMEANLLLWEPDTAIRQYSLDLEKKEKLEIEPIQVMIGQTINTNKLTVAIPAKYVTNLQGLIDSTCHVNQKSFTVQ